MIDDLARKKVHKRDASAQLVKGLKQQIAHRWVEWDRAAKRQQPSLIYTVALRMIGNQTDLLVMGA